MEEKIPENIRIRIPLFQPQWMSMIRKLRDHPDAPRWNTLCGDRLCREDLLFVKAFEEALHTKRIPCVKQPGETLILWIKRMTNRSWWFEDNLRGIDPAKEFFRIPFMERYDLQARLEQIVPHDADLKGLIINPTSGTTGRPLPCPSHPRAAGCYDPLLQFALQRHGVQAVYNHNRVAAIQFCCQHYTITYNTVHAFLDGAGFAKINLASGEWKDEAAPVRYTADMEPVFFSGDPFAFFMAKERGITYQPHALLSTALTLTPGLHKALAGYYRCPVVNLYSLNETGPIAYSCPVDPAAFHILPADLFVETVGDDGLNTGGQGEITVTGGRNPYLPLLRYRTGDSGVLDFTPCSCGDPLPRIKNLTARKTVFFYTPAGAIINPVDISRLLKDYPVILHQFIQERDYSCTLRLYPRFPFPKAMQEELTGKLGDLFGHAAEIRLTFDISPLEGKIIPSLCRLEKQEFHDKYF